MAGKNYSFRDRQVLLFSRYPEPGKTKTRLIPDLGAVRAANLQKKLTENIVDVARQFSQKTGVGLTLFGEGGSLKAFQKWLGMDLHVVFQSQGDIGGRMAEAFGRAFDNGVKMAVLVGSDIPHVTEKHLAEAFEALSQNDMVLGPSADGGYWLIGAKKRHDVFTGMDWGTDRVFDRTTRLMDQLGLDWCRLGMLSDIDTIDDVRCHLPGEIIRAPYVSVIIPALNEEHHIGKAVAGAVDESAEIIVVDGGSRDRTVNAAEAYGATVITAPKGRAVQQNQGAKHATGEVLLFLHGDTRLPEKFVYHVFRALLDSATVLGAFRFKTDLNGALMRCFEMGTHLRSVLLKLPYGDQGCF